MTYEEWIPKAKKMAEEALEKRFDVEAFLVMSEILNQEHKTDLIQETKVDDDLMDITGLFANWYHNRSLDNLELLLISIRKMLSELYNTAENDEERQLMKKHLTNLSMIINPTMI